MTDQTCPEIMADGEPCGLPANRLINLPNDRANPHACCEECGEYYVEERGATWAEAPAENKTPDEHSSLVGGSTAGRRVNCPRSLALEKIAPPDRGNEYSREGTALHEIMALVVGENRDPLKLLPFTFRREAKGAEEAFTFIVDDDLWYEKGQPALDGWDDFAEQIEAETGDEMVVMVENRCALPGIPGEDGGEGDAFGTTDVVWRCGDLTGIWDWKFGRTPVSADSDQLRFYGRAVANDMPEMFGAKSWGEIDQTREVVLCIMQPMCGDEPSVYRTTVAELEEFRLGLREAIAGAIEYGDKARIEKGSWCAFATCKSVCPLHVGQSLSFAEKMAKLSEIKGDKELRHVEQIDKETGEVTPIFDAVLPDLLELATMAKDFADEIFKQAHAYMEEGGKVDGWFLKAKASRGREWVVSDEEVKKFMKNRKFTLDDYMPRKMISMPQCEALLKKTKRVIPEEMYRKKPSSGTTMTRDADAAIDATSERAKQLGNKLAAFRDGTTEA